VKHAWALAALALLPGCGYKVAGKADLLPDTIRTIAVPAFSNATTRYRLTEWLPGAIGREFLSRTRYRIVADPAQADAVLEGSVLNVISAPTIFDTSSGRAAGVQISVQLSLKLVERATGKPIYVRPFVEWRQRYEVSIEQLAYFDESENALERMSREVARLVVSSVLEAF
jgi:hypothetical protein